MKWIFALIGWSWLALNSAAQITVLDAQSRQPVPGAAVFLISEAGSTVHVTGDAGGVSQGAAGQSIRVEMLGYFVFEGTVPDSGEMEVLLHAKTLEHDAAVVTGQSSQTTVDRAVHRMQVIDVQQARSIGALTVRDALELQSNINLVQDAALGTQVQLLGLGGQNVKVLVNGVAVVGRLDGNIDLDQLALVGIERIEVVEGPMGVEYGTDALAGTINIITRSPLKILTGEVRTLINTQNRSEFTGEVSLPMGPVQTRVIARRNYFDGLASNDSRVDLWKPKEQRNARIELSRELEKGRVGADLDYFDEQLWSDGAVQYQQVEVPINDTTVGIYNTPFAYDEVFNTRRISGRAFLNQSLGASWVLDGFVAANRFDRERLRHRKDLVTLEEQLTGGLEDHDTTSFVNLSSRTTFTRAGKHTLTAGYDVNQETASGKRFEGVADTYTNAAAFALAELTWGNFTARPGLRFQYHSVYDAPWIPSLNVRYARGENWVFRGSYGRGFRAPGLKELYFFFVDSNHNIQGNQGLKAETSHAFQGSAVRKQVSDRWYWTAEAQVFYNSIDDLIALALVDTEEQLYSYVNISEQTNYGLQLRGTWGFPRVKLDASLTQLWRSSVLDPSNRALDQPSLQAAAGVRYTFENLGVVASARYRYTGLARNYTLVDDEVLESETEAYGLLSVSASRSFWNDQLDVQLGANNLLNVVNVNQTIPASGGVHSGSAGTLPISTGRTIYLQLAWHFQRAN